MGWLYKKEILNKYNMKFLDEKKYYSEDIIFNFIYLSKCNNISYIGNKLYNYNINDSSMTKNYSTRYNYINVWYALLKEYADRNNFMSDELLDRLNRVYLINSIYRVKQEVKLKNNGIKEKMKTIKNIIQEPLFKTILSNEKLEKFNYKRRIILELAKRNKIICIYILAKFTG